MADDWARNRDAGQECRGGRAPKARPAQNRALFENASGEEQGGAGVVRPAQHLVRGEGHDSVEPVQQRLEQLGPGVTVYSQGVGGAVHVAVGDRSRAAVKRMRIRDFGGHERYPAGEFESPKERRCQSRRVHGGAQIVPETRQRDLGRAQSPTGRRGAFGQLHAQARPSQNHRGGQTVGPGSHHVHVDHVRSHHS